VEEGDHLVEGATSLDQLQPRVLLRAIVQNMGPPASDAKGDDAAIDEELASSPPVHLCFGGEAP
jgi:hypothetical protein